MEEHRKKTSSKTNYNRFQLKSTEILSLATTTKKKEKKEKKTQNRGLLYHFLVTTKPSS